MDAFSRLPRSAALCDDIAMTFLGMDALHEALHYHELSIRYDPENPIYHTHSGLTLAKLGHVHAAYLAHSKAISLNETFATAHNNLGNLYRENDNVPEALLSYGKALKYNERLWEASVNMGNMLKEMARFEESLTFYRKAIAINPNAMKAYRQISLLNGKTTESTLEQWKRLYFSTTVGESHKAHLAFAIGQSLFKNNQIDESFRYFSEGNELRRNEFMHDETHHSLLIDQIINSFDHQFFNDRNTGSHSRRPIFIVGLPRSGTTLIEHILSSHSSVEGAGEQPWLSDIASAMTDSKDSGKGFPRIFVDMPHEFWKGLADKYLSNLAAYDALRITDKMPNNSLRIALIVKMFPNASIVHINRDPIEVGFSIFRQYFSGNQPFAYSLDEIADHILSHYRLMTHWRQTIPGRIIDISYEAIVDNPRESISYLLQSCGLEWDDTCLEFHQNPRRVKTASLMQVRQPIYKSSLCQWKRYSNHLQPLIDKLSPLKDYSR